MAIAPHLLALDFDGVLCNGLAEYFAVAQRVYEQVWPGEGDLEPYRSPFYRLRPVIETGWEMPLLLRGLVRGYGEEELERDWPAIALELQQQGGIGKGNLAPALDEIRDRWIEEDLTGWLGLHQFYPGVLDQLRQWLTQGIEVYIITTKEKRFAVQLLHSHGVDFPEDHIIGKEVQRPKTHTLAQLLDRYACPGAPRSGSLRDRLWFVEDLPKTLLAMAQYPPLAGVSGFLATWGYNTAITRASLPFYPNLHPLSLEQFTGDLAHWLPSD